jgi:hypothetical protein
MTHPPSYGLKWKQCPDFPEKDMEPSNGESPITCQKGRGYHTTVPSLVSDAEYANRWKVNQAQHSLCLTALHGERQGVGFSKLKIQKPESGKSHSTCQ